VLTETKIKQLKAGGKDQFVSDIGGLYMRVATSGRKTFMVRQQQDGKSRWRTLGAYPEMTLVNARAKVSVLAEVAPDVIATIDAKAKAPTVHEVYRGFDKHHIANHTNPWESRGRFRLDILPAIGKMDISDVTRKDLFRVIQPILDRGSKYSANRTLSDLKLLFQFAVERGYIENDPAERITRKSCGGRETPRSRVLSFDELEAFLHGLLDDLHGKRGMHVTTIAALYLCLLTAQRASEVLWIMANWQPRQTSIVVPGWVAGNKGGRDNMVHLVPAARAALKLLNGLPIPNDHRVLSHALRRIEATFTPHDLRRTLATRLSDLGVEPYIIEKILNHRMLGVMAVYNHATYLPGRKAALDLWGRKVSELRRKRLSYGTET